MTLEEVYALSKDELIRLRNEQWERVKRLKRRKEKLAKLDVEAEKSKLNKELEQLAILEMRRKQC